MPDSRRRLVEAFVALLAMVLLTGGPGAAAELKGYAWVCGEDKGAKRLCHWHKTVVAPPKGWIENEAWTQRYKAVVMFPKDGQSTSDPIMYVRAHSGDGATDIDGYIKVAQERWQKKLPDSTIEPLADLTRKGRPTFKVFLYRNPSQPDQAFELTAFTKDVSKDYPDQSFFFQVVLAAPSMAKLEKAKAAFYDVLGRI